ncbi:unnamed protein product [Ectocarpus sp. CCAP 1310/34]|nr:unnamed protein product [Ectocarpus sp. CCAP 1310/34]
MVTRVEMQQEDWASDNNNNNNNNNNAPAAAVVVRARHQKHQADENSSPALLGLRGQRMMMPAESEPARVAGVSNKHLKHQSCNTESSSGNGDVTNKVEPLIVFDWDDTMLTSSWIQVNDLLQAGSYDELPLEVRRDLAQLERSVAKCFKNARRLGTVIIITNAESGWVELSAARFFVNVLPLLEGVPVISARSLFESQFPGSPLCWKSAAFAYMMHDHFLERPQWMQKKVVSIGDSNEEKVAMRIASGQHGTMEAKSVKFITGPDPEALACQLDFVTKHLASVLSSNSDVDIVLDASMIHGSYSLPLHSRGVYDDVHQQPQQQHQQVPLAANPRPSSTSSSSSSSTSSSDDVAAAAAATNPCCTASTSTAMRAQSPSAATASSTPPSSSSSTVSSSSSTTSGSARDAAGGDGVAVASRGRSSSMGSGGDRVERPTARSPSSSLQQDPSSSPQQYLALKRRASSSPIPIPPAAANAGGHHGRGRGGSATGGGGTPRSVEGGGDCVQPFPPSQPEDVGGALSSSLSSSCATAKMTPSSANGSSSGEGKAAMPPARTWFYRGRARNGSGGGRGAEGRSAYGGGFPCQVDGGSRPRGRGGDDGGAVGRRIKGVKSAEGSAVAGAETKAVVASEKGDAAGGSGGMFGVVKAVGGSVAPDAGAE